jgi:hypothetical protein
MKLPAARDRPAPVNDLASCGKVRRILEHEVLAGGDLSWVARVML